MAGDVTMPSLGSAFYYLVRAENACPAGQGPLGFELPGRRPWRSSQTVSPG